LEKLSAPVEIQEPLECFLPAEAGTIAGKRKRPAPFFPGGPGKIGIGR